jgi:hypothetical protein
MKSNPFIEKLFRKDDALIERVVERDIDRRFFGSSPTVEAALEELRRMIMDPSADAAAILAKLNALPGLIETQVTSEVTAAEAAKDAAHANDLSLISAAVDAATAAVTPANPAN